MVDEVLEASASADGTAAAAAEPVLDAKALAAEVAALKSQVAEKDEAVRFWHGKAKEGATPAKAAPAEAEDDTDLLDLIGTKGSKGLVEHLAKKGFVSGAEVDRRVEERAGQLSREAQLTKEFPDLLDDKSEFFKETAREYGRLQAQGVPKSLAMEQAAKNVRLAELQSGGGSTKKDPEADRVRRIKSQAGDRGTRSASTETGDELSENQRTAAAAMGVSEADFKASHKEVASARRGSSR